jgi:hypothetical protein
MQFLIRILGQLIRPILEGQGVLDYLTPENNTNRLFRNFGKKLTFYDALSPQKVQMSVTPQRKHQTTHQLLNTQKR